MRHRLIASLTLFALSVAVSGAPARAADVTFGETTSFQSDSTCAYVRTPDQIVFQFLCTGFETQVENGKIAGAAARRIGERAKPSAAATPPIGTRVFSAVVPVTGGSPVYVPIHLSGLAITGVGANAAVLLRVNGEDKIFSFPPKTDESFVRTFVYKAEAASELRMTLFILAEQDSKEADNSAFISLNAVDAGKADPNQGKPGPVSAK